LDRRLLRPRAAPDLAAEESCCTGRDLVRGHPDPGLRRFLPYVSRDAPSDRHRRGRDHRGGRVVGTRARHPRVGERSQVRKVAVVAHAGKSLGGGLMELRRELERQGVVDPIWVAVAKSRVAPKQVERALAEGADLLFVWGGDGTVQRSIDAMSGSETPLAILPAGTANLLATNLGIPQDIEQAVLIGLRGERRKLDVGRFNGERF